MLDDMYRKIGRTRDNLLSLPYKSVYIVQNATMLPYVRRLCEYICRRDIIIKSKSWFSARNWRGSTFDIYFDHSLIFTPKEFDIFYEYIYRKRLDRNIL